MKWDNAERRAIFDKLVALSETAPTGETEARRDRVAGNGGSLHSDLNARGNVAHWRGLAKRAGAAHRSGSGGTVGGRGEPRYYNSIFTIDERGEIVDTADKVHLVPFGEYLPYEHLLRGLGLQEVVEMPGGFTAGASRRALKVKDGRTFLPLICYEAIFPDELGYTGEKAGAIINVTNDGWYGDTPGPYQHFRQAQVRAVEQGLPLIRAANNGLSGVIDAYGRITAGLALDDVGVIDASLPSPRAPFWGIPPGRWQTVAVLLTLLVMSMAFRLSNGRRFH
ncbi:apolipoprotein N-acyltransferase [Ochrobactrum daejeonense]|nr:apolipoprotein N-acyltransferase [Brucella daejeonensis]